MLKYKNKSPTVLKKNTAKGSDHGPNVQQSDPNMIQPQFSIVPKWYHIMQNSYQKSKDEKVGHTDIIPHKPQRRWLARVYFSTS